MDRSTLLARGAALVEAGAIGDAEAAYRAMLDLAPDDAEALSNLSVVLGLREDFVAAEAAARSALAAAPEHWAAHAALGVALHRQQLHDAAVAAYLGALRRNPADVNSCTNLAVALSEQGRVAEALVVHDAAVAEAPEDATVHINRAMTRLAAGDLAAGFAELEWRWQLLGENGQPDAVPRWWGEDLSGRSILVHDEGGYGDTLQFVRYVPLLQARGARVVLRVQPPLVRLMQRSLPGVVVIARGAALPRTDFHCPMISLAHGFGTTLETVPATLPYLAACPEATAAWDARLGGGLRVGLVWAGESRAGQRHVHAMDRRRSMRLAMLAPLAGVPDVRLIGLQMGAAEAVPAGMALLDPMGAMRDFDDTASLVAALDLVISVDTAVAHLAGALGRPTWVLSRYDACWRWLAGRSDSPWYPTLRVTRQARPGDWCSVVSQVRGELVCAAGARKHGGPG